MFCSNCGKEIEDGSTVCPHCGTQLVAQKTSIKEKIKGKVPPILAVGVIFSLVAFVFGFILVTCVFTQRFVGMPTVEFYVLIPTFIGLGIGVYKTFDSKGQPVTKAVSIICAGLSAFVLVYAFVGYMVTIFG